MRNTFIHPADRNTIDWMPSDNSKPSSNRNHAPYKRKDSHGELENNSSNTHFLEKERINQDEKNDLRPSESSYKKKKIIASGPKSGKKKKKAFTKESRP